MTRASTASPEDTKQPGALAKFLEKLQRSRLLRANTLLNDQGGGVLAAGMSFQALFAVFAGLWILFSTFGFVLRNNPQLLETTLEQLNTMVPGLLGPDGVLDVEELLGVSGLTWTSAIAAVSLLWLVITWFTSTRTSIRLLFDLDTVAYENPVLLKLRDLLLALFFGVLILLSAAVTIAGSFAMDWVLKLLNIREDFWLFGTVGLLFRGLVMLGMYWFLLWAIHRILAEIKLPPKQLWLGTLPGALIWLVITILGSSLLGGASRNPLLAGFAVIIGMLLWFNFICRALLFTSAWIVAGEHRDRGLPPALVEKDKKERARIRALQVAGMDPEAAADLDVTMLEPQVRMKHSK